ncbi:uncharacterized protein PGTG_09292 [Puccinia graminis f. sp. tritici CRL 75-36-700-3]|uniref:Palmitoyltransferase PFA4 n=1 Tax=Puccinia graminis f. sp. tritici (strain CRL 75-36-700-3 / race SCCL) TaxID=418459 RepID=E3KH04_PUCGT|nr:uncharacterized protein PGTG_09292 [Puccinia graminis f. sp. tritici CRL 75-36-700-3]EFP83579.1 hypothetical protein PGTG_09292 [Puccinia graminis f. sp. tritici CRL 75-36-700-3]
MWSIDTGRLWIIGTTSLISFIAFTPQIFIIIPLFDHPSTNPDCLSLLIPFNILVGLLFINYYLCITTDPGRVPKEWDPIGLIESEEHDRAKILSLGQLRFCRACKVSKPPRAHHCRTCKRCVLKMDHHCPWVNNCVGHHNYGHFLRFLGFVDLACWYHIWMISKRVFGEFAYGPEPSKTEMIILVLNYVSCLPVILAVGVFSLYHLWAVLSNTTTIEGWEKEKARELRRKGRIQQFTYPFSIGIYRNLQVVLGPNPLLWWLPQRMSGDGLRYPTLATIDPLEQYLWPPRDLFTRRAPQLRRRQFEKEAFTYGEERLNPDLIPSGSMRGQSVPQGVPRRTVSPYHADYDVESDESEESDSGRLANGHAVDFSASDEEPLSTLVARRNQASGVPSHQAAVMARRPLVRRGSEGVEIKPVGPHWSPAEFSADPLVDQPTHDDERWLQVEGSEGSDGWD